MSEGKDRSDPDYQGWQDGIEKLPDRRFYFVVTMLIMALVVYFVSDSLAAVTVVSILMLAFGTIVFLLQSRSGDDQEEPEDSQVEPSDQLGSTRTAARADGDVGLPVHDGNDSPSPSSLRAFVGGKEREIPSLDSRQKRE